MKQKIKILFLSIVILGLGNIRAASEGEEIRAFSHSTLAAMGPEMIAEFQRVGYIAVEGVEGFADAYQRFLNVGRQFTALSPADQAECTPADFSGNGWSRGVEKFNGKTDTYKGSYYAKIPNVETNVWPDEILPDFRDAYQEVATLVLNVAREILPLVGFDGDVQALGRMLHYKSVPEGEDDDNPNWCGNHRDHGVFTGLCPEVYYDDAGDIVARPESSGLYIEGNPVAPRKDIMLFQMGEFMELLTNGKTRATDHEVKKALSGFERYALAVFIDPLNEITVTCDNAAVVEKYADRYEPGITYEEWGKRSYRKYNPEGSVTN